MARPHPPVSARLAVLAALALVLLLALGDAPRASAAIEIEPGPDTVTTSKFEWDFGDAGGNPELVAGVKWRNSLNQLSANLAADNGGGACGDSTEFWGQSYGNADGQGPGPVVAGSRGVWLASSGRTVEIRANAPTACSGDTPSVPVRTRYTFFDSGAAANKVRIERTWTFAPDQSQTGYAQGMRTYVPRLPIGTYNEVIYPNAAGTALVNTGTGGPSVVSDWNQTWVALNAPSTGSGVLILRDPANASKTARIVTDNDSSSGSNNSGISLDRPAGGWKAPVTETEYLCFYDAESWPLATRAPNTLPAGCSAAAVPINTAAPTAGAGAAAPRDGEAFTATPGTWDNATGAFGYQWQRCAGEACTPIPGAAAPTYTATAADVGKSLQVRVTATAPGGETDFADSSVAGSISGHVYQGEKGAGHEVAFAPVTVCRLSGSPCRSTTTDAAGLYRVQAPVAGNYRATAYPPAGSKAVAHTRTTIIRTRAETEKSGQDIVLPLPKLPPPQVGFSGAGVRPRTAEGVPVVHWQEPFVLEYEAKLTAKPEVTIEFGSGQKVRVKPRPQVESSPTNPENGIFLFDFPALFPNHGAAEISIGAAAGSPAEEKEQEEEESEEEEQEEEEDEEEEEPEEEPEDEEEEEETEEEEEKEEQGEEETEEEEEGPTFPIYIDPSGTVRTVDGAPLGGATVTLFEATSANGPFAVVPDGSAVMSPLNRHNPDQSEADGHFGWDVVAGFYRVRVEKAGCNAPGAPAQAAVETAVLTIPPPVTNLDLRLECPAPPAAVTPASSPPLPARPVVPPRLRVALRLPAKKVVKVTKSGAYTVKTAKVDCPAASPGRCQVALSVKAKKAELGSSKLSVVPGRTAVLAGKLSAAGLRKLGSGASLPAKLTVTATLPGGETARATIAVSLVRVGKH